MWGVGTTPATVLVEFQSLASIALALRRDVVAALALLARHRQRGSLVRSHLIRFVSVFSSHAEARRMAHFPAT